MDEKIKKIIMQMDLAIANIRSTELHEDLTPYQKELVMAVLYHMKKARSETKNLQKLIEEIKHA